MTNIFIKEQCNFIFCLVGKAFQKQVKPNEDQGKNQVGNSETKNKTN